MLQVRTLDVRIGVFRETFVPSKSGRQSVVIMTQGCEFRCPWCDRPALVCPGLFTKPVPENEVLRVLERRKLSIDRVLITGGEPAMHPGIIGFLVQIKRIGLPVELSTNGSHPEVVWEVLEGGLVERVTVSYKLPFSMYKVVSPLDPSVGYMVRESIRMVLERNKGEIRTKLIPGVHTDEIIAEMRREVPEMKLVL